MSVRLSNDGISSESLASLTLAHLETNTRVTLQLPANPQDLQALRRGAWRTVHPTEKTKNGHEASYEIEQTGSQPLLFDGPDESLHAFVANHHWISVESALNIVVSGRFEDGQLQLTLRATGPHMRQQPEARINVRSTQAIESAIAPHLTNVSWQRISKQGFSTTVSIPDLTSQQIIEDVLNRKISFELFVGEKSIRNHTKFSGVKFIPEGSTIGWQFRYRKLSKSFKKIAYRSIRALLPVQNNTYFFQSYLARALSDSPRALYEYIAANDSKARMVWSLNDINVPVLSNTTTVRPGSLAHYYYLARAKFIISNTGLADGFEKRKSQIHLQTWHGSPVKRVGRDKGLDDSQRKVRGVGETKNLSGFARRVSMWDYLIAANSLSAQAFSTAWRFGGEMLCMGYPRNDALLDDAWVIEKRAAVRREFGIPEDHTVALWAPTWTDDAPKVAGRRLFTLPIDLSEVARTEKLTILVKLHYLVADSLDDSGLGIKFINVSDWDDVNDLFPASDVLISDFSGVIPDYALTGKPVIIYSPDFDKYMSTRGTYVDLETAGPGPVVRTQTELFQRLSNLEWQKEFNSQREAFAEIYREYETGHACESVVNRVVNGPAPKHGESTFN